MHGNCGWRLNTLAIPNEFNTGNTIRVYPEINMWAVSHEERGGDKALAQGPKPGA